MFRNYYQVRDWLESFIPLVWGKEELGLARIKYLLKLLGNPHRKFESIHVAGTSGKGSTAFYTAKLLQHETRNTKHETRIGLHISPHLVDIRERMTINGEMMPISRFLRLFNEIKPVVEKIKRQQPDLTPSYFEILVAASFLYFAQEKVDWAVVEVGLGGRLDATNVLMPEVSVITNVGLDHTEILGKTVEKIAFEKAGIIKKGVPVVTAARSTSSGSKTGGRALEVIADVAKKRQAPLITIDTQKAEEAKFLALAAVEATGVKVNEKALAAAFEAKFAGRMEEIDDGVILDGAHNPDKIRFLIEIVRKLKVKSEKSKVILVVGFKKGKDWKRMVDLLIKEYQISNFKYQIIAAKFHAITDTGAFVAVSPKEIADYVKTKYKILNTKYYENSQEAVFEALNVTGNTKQVTGVVLVTGSLYLVGEVRTMWKLPEF